MELNRNFQLTEYLALRDGICGTMDSYLWNMFELLIAYC